MRVANFPWRARAAGAAVVALGLLLGPGCGLDKDDPPPLNGPSETGISVQLSALPDELNADGVSQSVIELVLRDQNGNPAPGRAVVFEIYRGDGRLVPSADSTYVGPLQGGGVVMATSEAGTAVVVYIAGRGFGEVIIGARPYAFDSIGSWTEKIVGLLQH